MIEVYCTVWPLFYILQVNDLLLHQEFVAASKIRFTALSLMGDICVAETESLPKHQELLHLIV